MTSLTLVRQIAARPSVVFDLMTTADGIATWWGPDAGPVIISESDPRVGGRFRVRFRMLDGNEYESSGEFLEVRKPDRFAMTWLWEGDEESSQIEVDLRAVDGGTEVTFTHANLVSVAMRDGHEKGWMGSLDKLERHVLEMADGEV